MTRPTSFWPSSCAGQLYCSAFSPRPSCDLGGWRVRSFHVPSDVTEIPPHAFAHCGSLETVTFGYAENLTAIGRNAFDSSGLTSFAWPPHVDYIQDNTFSFADLTSVTGLDPVKWVGMHSFWAAGGRGGLPHVYLPPGCSVSITRGGESFSPGDNGYTIGPHAYYGTERLPPPAPPTQPPAPPPLRPLPLLPPPTPGLPDPWPPSTPQLPSRLPKMALAKLPPLPKLGGKKEMV